MGSTNDSKRIMMEIVMTMMVKWSLHRLRYTDSPQGCLESDTTMDCVVRFQGTDRCNSATVKPRSGNNGRFLVYCTGDPACNSCEFEKNNAAFMLVSCNRCNGPKFDGSVSTGNTNGKPSSIKITQEQQNIVDSGGN